MKSAWVPINQRTDKENVVHIHNGILFVHQNKIMSFAGKWMKLEISILREIRQIQEGSYHMFSLKSRI
jgi:hypothetical protein